MAIKNQTFIEREHLFSSATSQTGRLLNRYGSNICLFHATYHTTCYAAILVFVLFVCVWRTVCSVVVGVMVVQEETTEAITEGPEISKAWNVGRKPAHFMMDYSLPEIKAVQSVFEGMVYRR